VVEAESRAEEAEDKVRGAVRRRCEWYSTARTVYAVFWAVTPCRVALVRTDVSEERIASIVKVEAISELGTTLAATTN
jgi:hypothetical protein